MDHRREYPESKSIEARWRAASALIHAVRDIVEERPEAPPPQWVESRDWTAWLLAIDDPTVEQAEIRGLAAVAHAAGAPSDLIELAEQTRAVCDLPGLTTDRITAPTHRIKTRKQIQLAAFAAAIAARFTTVQRVVDIGAGHGHLTRHLADALGVEALGLERDPRFVDAARGFAQAVARFEVVDLFAEQPDVQQSDLLVGLHACGALSDRLVDLAIESGAAVAFISCCLHKQSAANRTLGDPSSTVPRWALGLANIVSGAHGVEASLRTNRAARTRRAGLRWLLRQRGLSIAEGDEMRGLNRRQAHREFATLVANALRHRELSPASPGELKAAQQAGQREQAYVRRWAIVRRMFGRPLEILVNLDRAMRLVDAGYQVELGHVWPIEASPRNIGVLAQR